MAELRELIMLKVSAGCGFRAEEDKRNSSTFTIEKKLDRLDSMSD